LPSAFLSPAQKPSSACSISSEIMCELKRPGDVARIANLLEVHAQQRRENFADFGLTDALLAAQKWAPPYARIVSRITSLDALFKRLLRHSEFWRFRSRVARCHSGQPHKTD